METLLRDLTTTCRSLVRRPAFALTVVATLALASAFLTVLFSVVQGVLLDPLPFPGSERLIALQSEHAEQGVEDASVPDFLDWRQRAGQLDGIAGFRHWSFTYAGSDEPMDVPSVLVTPDLLPLLGARAAKGRIFNDAEGVRGRDKVVVVSWDFWQRELGGSGDVLGRVLELDAELHEVVGVMPRGFEFPPEHDARIWGALSFDLSEGSHDSGRQIHNLSTIARLRPGVELAQARQELDRIAADLAAEYPDTTKGWGIRATGIHEQLVGEVRPVLLSLFGAVGLLLLIACANLANLTLARLASRQREIAVRTAMGATRRQLVRQLLAESVLLALAGGLAGLGLSVIGVRLVRGMPGEVLPRLGQVALDGRVVAFTFGVCLAAALAFGLVPALRACRANVADHLHHRATSTVASQRVFGALVVAQVALALVLVVGAGLMTRSFVRLTEVDPGFDPEGVLAATIYLPRAKYTEPHHRRGFYDRMLADLANSPGIKSTGAVTTLPMSVVGIDFDLPFEIDGRPPATEGEEPQADFRIATPGYFETLRIPLRRGRTFGDRDREGSAAVMLINETMARRHFPGEDPIGRFITMPMGGRREVVGVVADLKHYGLDREARPEMYVPFAQLAFSGMTVVARTNGEPAGHVKPMSRAAQAADPAQAVYRFNTLRELLDRVLFLPRLNMVILGLFAACSCLLAAVGIYGVMTALVARRTREIGVRVALGARASEVMWMVIRRGMALTAAGIACGLLASVALTRLIGTLLFRVDPLDPVVLAAACAAFAAVALLANAVPAARAMRVDPVAVLTAE
ncbi:MAG: ABC transporter permease [bacterium]|nr:ABC transporter permease [bacterium]